MRASSAASVQNASSWLDPELGRKPIGSRRGSAPVQTARAARRAPHACSDGRPDSRSALISALDAARATAGGCAAARAAAKEMTLIRQASSVRMRSRIAETPIAGVGSVRLKPDATGRASCALCRLQESFEERTELAGAEEVLRMPLDAEAELRCGIFDRLDDAVRRR